MLRLFFYNALNRNHTMRKLCTFCISFSTAIFLAQYLIPSHWLLAFAGICLAVFFIVLLMKIKQKLRLLLISIGLGIGFLWNLGYSTLVLAPAQTLNEEIETVQASVCSAPEKSRYGVKVNISLKTETTPLRIQTVLYADEEWETLQLGDEILLTARFAVSNQLGEETVTYYTSKGIYLLAYQVGDIEIIAHHGPSWFDYPVLAARRMKQTLSALYQDEHAAFLKSLLTGDRSDLSDSMQTLLSRTGLSHVVAVSGMHLSFLAGMILLLPGSKKKKFWITVSVLLFFMVATGNSPSVVRAGIMQILLLLAPVCKRETDLPTSLSFALFVLLAINPFSAANVGLQLSFASVAGIFLFSNRIYDSIQTKANKIKGKYCSKLVRALGAGVASSVGALSLTIPLTAWYFGTVSLISILSNLLVLWAVSLVFAAGLFSGVLGMLLFPLGKLISILITPLIQYILGVVEALGNLPLSAVSTTHVYTRLWIVFAYLVFAVYLFFPFLQKRKGKEKKAPAKKERSCRVMVPVCICIVSFCMAMTLNWWTFQKYALTVSVLDVGQGESVVLLSKGKAVVVDCGGSGSPNAGNAAADYLQNIGINTVECLVLSHYHADHANGVDQLFRRMKVMRVAAPNLSEMDSLQKEILTSVEQEQAELYFAESTITIAFGEAKITIYPPVGSTGENELGASVLCTAGEFDLLITGDMDQESEELLLERESIPDLEALVVGHHGSKYSTGDMLLDQTTPEAALISVGRNSYGHPAPETLERLDQRNIKWYRTDEQGTIVLQIP